MLAIAAALAVVIALTWPGNGVARGLIVFVGFGGHWAYCAWIGSPGATPEQRKRAFSTLNLIVSLLVGAVVVAFLVLLDGKLL